MEKIHYGVAWYQKKIGSYDKQVWEQSVEQKVLKGLKQAPRRSVSLKLKSELIDVDLVRGSTFSKAKPQVSWTYITHKAFTRVILFPFFYKWWLQQTSFKFWVFLLILYLLQVATIIIFFRNVGGSISQDEFSLTEVVIPGLLMFILGLIHSQTVLSHTSHRNSHRDGKHMSRDGKGRKKAFPGYKKKNPTLSEHVTSHISNVDISRGSQGRQPHHLQEKVEDSGIDGTIEDLSNGKETHNEIAESSVSFKKKNIHMGMWKEPLISKRDLEVNCSVKSDQIVDLDQVNGRSVTDSKSVSWSDEYTISGCLKKGHESQDSEEPREEESHEEKEASDDEMNGKFEILSMDKNELELLNKAHRDSSLCEKSLNNLKMPENTDGELVLPKNNKIQLNPNLIISLDKLEKDKEGIISSENKSEFCQSVGSDGEISAVRDTEAVILENVDKIDSKESSEESSHDKDLSVKHSDDTDVSKGSQDKDLPLNHTNDSDVSTKKLNNTDLNDIDSPFKNFSDSDLLIKSERDENNDVMYCDSFSFNALTNGQSNVVNSDEKNDTKFRENIPARSRSLSGQFRTLGMKRVMQSRRVKNETGSETENDNMGIKSFKGLRRRKVPGTENNENGYNYFRSRRTPPSSLKLNYTKESTGISSSEGENSPNTPKNGCKGTVSSEEWEDRVQSDVTTSTYSSSSCGSGAEISENETNAGEDEEESANTQAQTHSRQASSTSLDRMTASNLHVINLLQPQPSSQHQMQQPDKVSCMIWEGNECKKVDLTTLDIGWSIIEKVDDLGESSDYIIIGLAFSLLLGFVPLIFITYHAKELPEFTSLDGWFKFSHIFIDKSWRTHLIIINGMIQRLCLSGIFFFLLSVADRTFKQRLLYAKHFCYLTSSRRAKKFDMPHFRLNKVRNIKTWLSLRSYLKKRGPQRSVDVIVSASFLVTIILLTLMCLQLLKDADTFLDFLCNWELCVWCMALGIYLLRFMTLGLKINKKYRNLSVLITEQINLYLQMEQKPHKKEELMVANNVLKLAEDLLKELESPFKISGVSANPVIYNVTKVVVLSAFSAVLTELLGFKLKLYKIKLKA